MTDALARVTVLQPVQSPRQFLILPRGQTPDRALHWRSAGQRNKLIRAWRGAMMASFATSVRAIKLCWVLSDLVQKKGFAYGTDAYLARESHLAVNKVQETLGELSKGGAIIRCHPADNPAERHIWLSAQLLADTPQTGVCDTPRLLGGQNKNNKTQRSFSALSQLEQAFAVSARRQRQTNSGT